MNIISGVSRSGTSLMMGCIVEALGEERVFGVKFPQQHQVDHLDKPYDGESSELFELRHYANLGLEDTIRKNFEKSKNMNPTGFWESPYVVSGLYYRWGDRRNIEKWLSETTPTFCKIVARGLWQTDPSFVDKIAYMIRHPRAIAKSQERLDRSLPIVQAEDGSDIDLADMLTVNTPELYVDTTIAVAAWLSENPDIPLLLVEYDDLVESPEATLRRVGEFFGEPLEKGAGLVNRKLRRSEPTEYKHVLWSLAQRIYELFIEGKYDDIVKLAEEHHADIYGSRGRFYCFRRDLMTTHQECAACISGGALEEFRKTASERGVAWGAEPCAYECGMGPKPHISVRDSIKNNFWER